MPEFGHGDLLEGGWHLRPVHPPSMETLVDTMLSPWGRPRFNQQSQRGDPSGRLCLPESSVPISMMSLMRCNCSSPHVCPPPAGGLWNPTVSSATCPQQSSRVSPTQLCLRSQLLFIYESKSGLKAVSYSPIALRHPRQKPYILISYLILFST